MTTIQDVKAAPETRYGRDWRKFSIEKLLEELSKIRFAIDIADVQGMWNSMEINLAELSDLVAPITKFTNNQAADSQVVVVVYFILLILSTNAFIMINKEACK